MSLDDRRAKAIFSFAGGFKGFPNCGSVIVVLMIMLFDDQCASSVQITLMVLLIPISLIIVVSHFPFDILSRQLFLLLMQLSGIVSQWDAVRRGMVIFIF